MSTAAPSLAEEALYLHRSLFGETPDPVTIERYAAAHRKLFPNDAGSPLLARIVSRGLDVEAVEFALRRRGAGGELTRKIQILSYLVEVRARYQHCFVSIEPGRAKAVVELAAAVIRSSWKFVKGEYLVRRHGLR
jgi:hypothetical protein